MPEPLPLKRPATPDDLAAALCAAAQAGTQVKITGSDSLPLTQFDTDRPLQPISTLRMNKVLDHAVADMTVAVHAGITLEALQKQLAWQDQWLPVDPPTAAGRSPGGRTIGGMIATNSLGPLRQGLAGGDWRRLILGIRWVDAAGTLIKGGGQTVKNVAGYSSPRMLIGSAATLGVIAEVTLRTFARPTDERCVIFFCPDADRAEALLSAILVSPTTPDYVQLVSGRTWAGNPLGLPVPAEQSGGHGTDMVLVVGFLGRPETCAAQAEIVRHSDAAKEMEAIAQTAAQAGRLRLWMTSEPAPDPQGIAFRLHATSSQIAELIGKIDRASAGKAWLVSEATAGVLRGVLPADNARTIAADLTQLHGGNLMITQGNFLPPVPNPLTTRLKLALDPQGTLGQFP